MPPLRVPRILLPVRMRIHWGMGRFWAIFFASVRFVRKASCGATAAGGRAGETARATASAFSRDACVQRFDVASGPPIRGVGGETRRPAALVGASRARLRGPPHVAAIGSRRAQERGICPTTDVVCVRRSHALAAGERARRAGAGGARFAKAVAGPPRARRAAFRCKPARGAIDSARPARVSV